MSTKKIVSKGFKSSKGSKSVVRKEEPDYITIGEALDLLKELTANKKFWEVYSILDYSPYWAILGGMMGDEQRMRFMNRLYLLAKEQFDPKGENLFFIIDDLCRRDNLTAITPAEILEVIDHLKAFCE